MCACMYMIAKVEPGSTYFPGTPCIVFNTGVVWHSHYVAGMAPFKSNKGLCFFTQSYAKVELNTAVDDNI